MQADISVIYIVVAVIWFIVKVIGKGSKGNKTPHAPIPGNFEDILNAPREGKVGKRPSFEDLLKEFTQESEAPTQETPPKEIFVEERHEPMVHEKKYVPVPVLDYDDTPVSITKEGVPTLKELQFETYQMEAPDTHLATEVNDMLKSPDGIRQAVLINEILTPKYF